MWPYLLVAVLASSAQAADVVDRFFDTEFKFHPTEATSAGFHEYDSKLEDYSRAAIDAEIAWLTITTAPSISAGNPLLVSHIRARLLDLETRRTWEINPDLYSSGIANSAFTIMSRKYAPANVRLRSLIARERRMPAALEAARANLKNPPKIYTEIAIEQLPGIISFFEKDVPAAFPGVKNADFGPANRAVIDALISYQKFLKDSLLPRSQGDFRLRADLYRKKLLYDEMVDTPLEKLLEIGYKDLRRNQEAFRSTAAKLDAKRTPQQVLEQIEKEHPPSAELLQAFR